MVRLLRLELQTGVLVELLLSRLHEEGPTLAGDDLVHTELFPWFRDRLHSLVPLLSAREF